MILSPDTSTSLSVVVGASSTAFGASMVAGLYYAYVADVASWISQGASPVATTGAGSAYVPAGVIVTIDGALGADVAVIEASTGGRASLTRARRF